MAIRKTRVRKHVIADMSLHHLAYIIASCTFTIEPTQSDYGYDLSVFTFDPSGQYENGNIFVQLKATDNIKFDSVTGDVKFRISKRDVMTWESEPFPVYLVVFDSVIRMSYSIYLQRYFKNHNISSGSMKRALT
jgi:expansin (peptidoglycan-binding protein)